MIIGLMMNNPETAADNQLVFIFIMMFYIMGLMILFGYIFSVRPRD